MKKNLKDPADAGKEVIEDENEFDSLDVSKIKVEVLPDDAAKVAHPFDGYPVKKIKIQMGTKKEMRQVGTKTVKEQKGTKKNEKGVDVPVIIEKEVPIMGEVDVPNMVEFKLTDWVLHNHIADPVHQDPSNKGRRTYHGRSIMDILGGNSVPNVSIQFSTMIETATGKFYGALVPDPYIRAQLIFKREPKTGAIRIDKRYMLLDTEQKNRLKQCFFQLIKPQLDMEKVADQITAGEEPIAMKEVEYGATNL